MWFKVKIKSVVTETGKATLVDFGFDQKWVPKSATNVMHEGKTLRMTEWFFKKNYHWLCKLPY